MKARVAFVVAAALAGGCLAPYQPGAQQPSGGGGYYGGQPLGGGGGGDPATSATPIGGGAPSGQGGPAAPPVPTVVSVTIRSQCPHTVKVFYGDKPTSGSGTSSSIASHSVQDHSFRSGDMLWIVDDSENGVASMSVGPGTHEIEIASNCTSLSSR